MKDSHYIVVGNNGVALVKKYNEAISFKRYFVGHVWIYKASAWIDAQAYAHTRLVERMICPERIPAELPMYQCITGYKLKRGDFDVTKERMEANHGANATPSVEH